MGPAEEGPRDEVCVPGALACGSPWDEGWHWAGGDSGSRAGAQLCWDSSDPSHRGSPAPSNPSLPDGQVWGRGADSARDRRPGRADGQRVGTGAGNVSAEQARARA